MSGSVTITGQQISARTQIANLTGTEPMPLGMPGDPCTNPNQLKQFMQNSLAPIDQTVISGTFTIDAPTAANMSLFQPVTLFSQVLGSPLINSDYYEMIPSVLTVLSTPTHTLPNVNFQYQGGNIHSNGYVSFLAARLVDFRQPTNVDGPPYTYDEYVRGTFINGPGSVLTPVTNPVDTTTSQFETVDVGLADWQGYGFWHLKFSQVANLDAGAPANSFKLVCQLVFEGPTGDQAPLPTTLNLAGTHSWSIMIRKYRVGAAEAAIPVAHSTLIGWYPKMSQTRGIAPAVETAYSALVPNTTQGITLNVVTNGTLHSIITPYQYALLGSTTWVDDVNTQFAGLGVDLVFSQVDPGDGVYRLIATSPHGNITSVSFPQNSVATARGSDKSNFAEVLLNLEELSFTLQ